MDTSDSQHTEANLTALLHRQRKEARDWVEPAADAGDALKARGQWIGPEPISSNQEWQDLWSSVWHLSADGIVAVDVRRYNAASNYTPLAPPLQAALGDEFPIFHSTEFLTATSQDFCVPL